MFRPFRLVKDIRYETLDTGQCKNDYLVSYILNLTSFCSLAVIKLGQAALAGFPEAVVQVHAGFPHGPADHVVADVPGAGEEIA